MENNKEAIINDILLKNGFDILENGCCYTDKHRIERAMEEYAANRDYWKQRCLQADLLLQMSTYDSQNPCNDYHEYQQGLKRLAELKNQKP